MTQNAAPRRRKPARDGAPLSRALSKLGLMSRKQADGVERRRAPWRTIVFHKPRGVVTTRRDPDGRPTVYDVLGEAAGGLIAVGRLDLATSGLILLTSDTRLADWITDPAHEVPRVYAVSIGAGIASHGRAARRP